MPRVFRLLAQLLDVDVVSTPPADGDALTYDDGVGKWVPAAGGGGGADDQTAAEVPFTPAGTIAATDTQSAVEEVASDAAAAVSALSTVYQPLDSDLTSIAALTTTSFGRGLLELANQAALLSAAGAAAASHVHAGEDITSGTVADARIASTIARDSEVTSAISALSSVYQAMDTTSTRTRESTRPRTSSRCFPLRITRRSVAARAGDRDERAGVDADSRLGWADTVGVLPDARGRHGRGDGTCDARCDRIAVPVRRGAGDQARRSRRHADDNTDLDASTGQARSADETRRVGTTTRFCDADGSFAAPSGRRRAGQERSTRSVGSQSVTSLSEQSA